MLDTPTCISDTTFIDQFIATLCKSSQSIREHLTLTDTVWVHCTISLGWGHRMDGMCFAVKMFAGARTDAKIYRRVVNIKAVRCVTTEALAVFQTLSFQRHGLFYKKRRNANKSAGKHPPLHCVA